MQVNPRRLYRSRDRQLAGVAGGMAEYLDIDPTVMRILWIVIGIVSGGLALIAYILLALVIPQAPTGYMAAAPGGWAPPPGGPGTWGQPAAQGTAWTPPAAQTGWATPAPAAPAPRAETRGIGAAAIIGVVLIVVGAIALADAALPGWAAGALLGPAVILALGAALLVASIRRPADETASPSAGSTPAPGSEPIPAMPWEATDTQVVDSDRAAGETGSQPGSSPA
jgi:phage shock protein C